MISPGNQDSNSPYVNYEGLKRVFKPKEEREAYQQALEAQRNSAIKSINNSALRNQSREQNRFYHQQDENGIAIGT